MKAGKFSIWCMTFGHTVSLRTHECIGCGRGAETPWWL